ncbi:energy-dependent translational throttle protein EttA-like [Hyalella azteca]|uniref:Energy-dependent translational throttle protein EttA-like n=1 Tax=Hyalella azteca TaxID=294128 RepID=A0A979FJG5_HYAAZ|nr:energy-dependent translational throttle protein EttA-like [Hyalella azteca]
MLPSEDLTDQSDTDTDPEDAGVERERKRAEAGDEDLALRVVGLSQQHASRMADRLALEDLNLAVTKGEVVGVVGANGAGKSTLFKLLVGDGSPPSSGKRLGP